MKGIVTDSLLSIILMIATAVIVLIFVVSIGSTSFVDAAPCTGLSMLSSLDKAIRGISVAEVSTSNIERSDFCPPMRVSIPERASERTVVKTVAEQMAMCHRNYGEGDLDLFEQGRGERSLYCVLCSVIELEGTGTVHGLSEYLESELVPGKKITYAEYIGTFDDERFEYGALPEFNLSRGVGEGGTDLDYGVFYFYGKKNEFFANQLEVVGTTGLAGGAIGTAAGAYVGAIAAGAAMGAIGGIPGIVVGGLIVGPAITFLGTQVGTAAGTAAGVVYGSKVPTGTDFVGSTVLVPWDPDSFGTNHLNCDRMVVS